MTAKTFEDFETMEVDQLKGILKDLDVAVPQLDFRKAENKAKLVQLAYDVSQPEPSPEDEQSAEDKPEEKKPVTTSADFEAQKQEILDHFGATDLIEAGEDDDGVNLFSVFDEMEDVEKASGTFLELLDQARNPENVDEPPSLDGEDESDEPAPP